MLGLYPTTSTDDETESIRARERENYTEQLEQWRKIEVIHLRLLAIAERERQERMRREYAAHMCELGMSVVGVVREGNDGEIEGQGKEARGEGGVEEESENSSSTATPVATQENTPFRKRCVSDQTPPTDTPQTPPQTPPQEHPSRSASPELIASETSLTQSTTSPLPSPHTPHPQTHPSEDYIITLQNDIVTKTRSSSVDSGHSSSNLGNSIGSSQGNGLVNGCHGNEHVGEDSTEWNGDSCGMELGQEGGEELALSTLTIVPDAAAEEEEGEGETELDGKGRMFADELFKIDKDIPRCDRDYW